MVNTSIMENALTNTFTGIANTIRTETGVSGKMTPSQMASKIATITPTNMKFGMSMDNMFGDVDQDGLLLPPMGCVIRSDDIVSMETPLSYSFYEN